MPGRSGGPGSPKGGLKGGGKGMVGSDGKQGVIPVGMGDRSGLNPARQRGFNMPQRIETPTLNDMKAKQGAIVSKFMTFMNRKESVMIELYERSFYTRRPGWDSLANFVYNDLCPTDVLRQSVQDVQFHPVKMIVFVKFKNEGAKNIIASRLQSPSGVLWSEYGVHVKGYCLDSNVKVIRVLGVSPETSSEDIKSTFSQVGIGEVVDLKKGLLDPKRMPGVTNGTWLIRVRISDPNKAIPPYIIRREEGELWSLNFDGRRFVCWKCGSSTHIGDKCRDQERTFEEVFGEEKGPNSPVSWAAVVRGNSELNDSFRSKRDEIERRIQLSNAMRGSKGSTVGDEEVVTHTNSVSSVQVSEQERSAVSREEPQQTDGATGLNVETALGDSLDNISITSDLPEHEQVANFLQHAPNKNNKDLGDLDGTVTATNRGDRDAETNVSESINAPSGDEVTQPKITIDRIDPSLLGALPLDKSFEKIFGTGATKLALEFESNGRGSIHGISDRSSESDPGDLGILPVDASTPEKDSVSKKRFRGEESMSSGEPAGTVLREGLLGKDSLVLDSKKQKMRSSSTESLSLNEESLDGVYKSSGSFKDQKLTDLALEPEKVTEQDEVSSDFASKLGQ